MRREYQYWLSKYPTLGLRWSILQITVRDFTECRLAEPLCPVYLRPFTLCLRIYEMHYRINSVLAQFPSSIHDIA